MTSRSSEPEAKRYFCTEPWVGMFAIETNQDVTFCPCFLKMKIGNLKESSIQEVWNAEPLVRAASFVQRRGAAGAVQGAAMPGRCRKGGFGLSHSREGCTTLIDQSQQASLLR